MGYRNLGPKNHDFGPRKGLEGPFQYANGRVLYYDPREGQYWDPRTDFYVGADEVSQLDQMLFDLMTETGGYHGA
jgi:hypothetical protein